MLFSSSENVGEIVLPLPSRPGFPGYPNDEIRVEQHVVDDNTQCYSPTSPLGPLAPGFPSLPSIPGGPGIPMSPLEPLMPCDPGGPCGPGGQ